MRLHHCQLKESVLRDVSKDVARCGIGAVDFASPNRHVASNFSLSTAHVRRGRATHTKSTFLNSVLVFSLLAGSVAVNRRPEKRSDTSRLSQRAEKSIRRRHGEIGYQRGVARSANRRHRHETGESAGNSRLSRGERESKRGAASFLPFSRHLAPVSAPDLISHRFLDSETVPLERSSI